MMLIVRFLGVLPFVGALLVGCQSSSQSQTQTRRERLPLSPHVRNEASNEEDETAMEKPAGFFKSTDEQLIYLYVGPDYSH